MGTPQKTPAVSKSAHALGLPSGDAVLRDGQITILPPTHGLDSPRLDNPRKTDVGPYPMPSIPQTVNNQTILKTSHMDRADAFVMKTSRLSFIVGGVAVLFCVWQDVAPMLSLLALFIFALGVLATWAGLWLVDQVLSPDGLSLVNSLLGYRLIRHEQKERQERYRHGYE